MSEKKEKIKKIAVAVLAVVFAVTAYVRFFKGTPIAGRQPATSARKDLLPPSPVSAPETTKASTTLPVFAPEKSPDAAFEPAIRDIFSSPVSIAGESLGVRGRMTFTGAIIWSGQSVAIIDDAFYHVGDTLGDCEIVSISEKNVRMDSPRGTVTLEIIHEE